VERASEGVQLRILSRELLAPVDGSELPLLDSVSASFTAGGGVFINNRSSLPTTSSFIKLTDYYGDYCCDFSITDTVYAYTAYAIHHHHHHDHQITTVSIGPVTSSS